MGDASHFRKVLKDHPHFVTKISDSGFVICANESSAMIEFRGQRMTMTFDQALILSSLLSESTAWIARTIEEDKRFRN